MWVIFQPIIALLVKKWEGKSENRDDGQLSYHTLVRRTIAVYRNNNTKNIRTCMFD